jgi:hypothetical protein
MNRFYLATRLAALASLAFTNVHAHAETKGRNSPVFISVKPLAYADVADMVMAAPVIAKVRVKSAQHLSGKAATGVIPGRKRYVMTGDVMTLIRGDGGIAPRITWLVDQAADARGKFPKLAKVEVIVLAHRVAGQPGEVQLVSPDAQLFMTADAGLRAHAIAAEAASPAAPPVITGITDAFYTPGPVDGESTSQIFLATRDDRPVSIGVVRQPGHEPAWSLFLKETVGDGTPPPRRDTLLWYRLACALPDALPASAATGLPVTDKAKLDQDYALVRSQLGPCTRTIKPPVAR